MATNKLSMFGEQTVTSYLDGRGLRYTDDYWKENYATTREAGFIPNTPISPIQINTILSQVTLTSYILGQVLVNSNVVKSKSGSACVTHDITSGTTTTVAESIAKQFCNFLNRINEISGNGGTGTESVWRSRQLANSDNSATYWYVNSNGTLLSTSNSSQLNVSTLTATTISASQSVTTDSLSVTDNGTIPTLTSTNITASDVASYTGNFTGEVYVRDLYVGISAKLPSDVTIATNYNISGGLPGIGYTDRKLEDILININNRLAVVTNNYTGLVNGEEGYCEFRLTKVGFYMIKFTVSRSESNGNRYEITYCPIIYASKVGNDTAIGRNYLSLKLDDDVYIHTESADSGSTHPIMTFIESMKSGVINVQQILYLNDLFNI